MWRVGEWLAVLWPRRWWYSWRHARHVVRVTEAERMIVGEGDPRFGSMSLTDEPVLNHEWPPFLAAGVPDEWDDDTLASLRDDPGPEAEGDPGREPFDIAPGPDLYDDDELAPSPVIDAFKQRQWEEQQRMESMIVWPETRLADTGDIAQAHAQPSRWLTEQLAVLHAWSEWQQQKMALA